ncbi:MAG: hypothetical protein QOI57_1349 [Rubrobacteraceae bacterium]|nr:hypothetical protein [Rubrobacteraceae bacterium]
MMLSGRCEVIGLEEGGSERQFVVRELEESQESAIIVVGRPASEAIEEAVRRNPNGGIVMAAPEDASHVLGALPGWTATWVTLYLLGDPPRLPRLTEGQVRPFGALDLAAVSDDLPEDLRSFLENVVGREEAPATAALAKRRPVSFCVASDQTEGLWDISIDTLERYRRQGYAARCVSYMIDEMRRRGKEPVWAAEETNPPSMRLAVKLGFFTVDGLVLFRPPART